MDNIQLKNEGISLDLLNEIIGEDKRRRQLIFELTSQPGFSTDGKKLKEMAAGITQELGEKLSIPVKDLGVNLVIDFRRIKIMPIQSITDYMVEPDVEFKGRHYKNYLTGKFDLKSSTKSFETLWISKHGQSSWYKNPLIAYMGLFGVEGLTSAQ